MPLDTLICGLCEETFTDLNDFVVHKQTGCTTNTTTTASNTPSPLPQQIPLQPSTIKEEEVQQEEVSTSLPQGAVPVQLGETNGHEAKMSPQTDGDVASIHPDGPDLTFLDDVHAMETELGLGDQGSHPEPDEGPSHTYVILKDAATMGLDPGHGGSQEAQAKMEPAFPHLEGSELDVLSASQLMASASSVSGSGGTTTVVISQQEYEAILQKQQQGQIAVIKDTIPAKRPRAGRAKKGEGKNQILEAVPPSTPRPSAPEINADGKLVCPQCKRTFTKQRHFNTHKCLASSSYLDISKRDVVKIDSGDEEEDVSLYLDIDDGGNHHGNDDHDEEFRNPVEESLEAQKEEEEDEHQMDQEEEEEEEYRPGNEEDGEGGGGRSDGDNAGPVPKRRKVVRRRGRPSRAKALVGESPLEGDGTGGIPMKQVVEAMENLPIFKNEEDKVAFEACIDVDLSQVDHMFRIHVIEQELNNTSGAAYNTPAVSSLSVYSCGICEKVFKSLSHIRLHCITHTDLKPFKCHKCDYTTNSKGNLYTDMRKHTGQSYRCDQCGFKTVHTSHLVEHHMIHDGNLYTHMRKHTGQYYRCDQCDFKTVNKSHLVEHHMTHDSRRPTCLLCHKDYSTVKSMINHIRKYHTNKAGRDYLATFLSGRGQKGNAIIHQCSVCNRKFKKRIDRDRHLFIHDIKDLPNVQMCELCDYWASRKVYLDKHYAKHRVIYCCVVCQNKFLSVTRLSEHLNTEHCPSEDSGVVMSDALLQECINKSYYLPEPMATTVEGSKYVNLPTVLTDSGQGQMEGQGHQHSETPSQTMEGKHHANTEENGNMIKDSNPVSDGSDNKNPDPRGFSPLDTGTDSGALLGLVDESNGLTTAKMETGSELESCVGHGDIVVSAASTSSDTTAFPFSSEYRELIQGTAQGVGEGEPESGVSHLKTEEGIIMMMPSLGGPLVDSDNSVVTCLTTNGVVETVAGGEEGEKADSIMSTSETIGTTTTTTSTPSPSGVGDKDMGVTADQDGTQTLTQPLGVAADPASPNLLMLQNPGSDTEEKEGEGMDEEVEEEDEAGSGGQGDEGLEEEGEATPNPQMSQGDGVNKEMAGDWDNGSPEGTTASKASEGQNEVIGSEGDPGVKASEGSKQDKIQSIIDKMGYRRMTLDIFNKMRETFGTEECQYCGRLFYNKMDHQMHTRTHTGDKPFACSSCSFRATTRDGLRRHSEKEHEKIAYQCKECDFLAPTRTRLWNHQLKHLGITGLSCSQCPEKFDSMKQLRAHLLNTHQDMDRDDLEKLTGYTRRPQGKMGRRSFKCPHCPRVFIRANSELQKHIWIHEGIKPFACPLCPYACRSKNNLQAHMLRHSAEKPFSCSECGKEYKSKTALRWHVRSHKSGKLFKCDKCPYEATQSSHLKRHMEIHDVMKRFVCKHCQFSANTLGYMKIHYAKHHKGQPFIQEESTTSSKGSSQAKGVYKCLSCGYLFGNLSDLKRHLKVRHHIQIQDIAGMDQMHISEVEVVQLEDTAVVMGSSTQALPDVQQVQQVQVQQVQQQVQHQVIQPVQVSATSGEYQLTTQDEAGGSMPAATASLIQQILGMDQGDNHQVRVVSEDGQPLDISPDTIILQQDGQLLMTNEMPGGLLPGNQYIIQYFNPGEVSQESAGMGDNSASPPVQPIVSAAAHDQIHLVQTLGETQPNQPQAPQPQPAPQTQFILTPSGEIGAPTQVMVTSNNSHPSPHVPIQPAPPPPHLSNPSTNQYVLSTPANPVEHQHQVISIDGHTHRILSTPSTPTPTHPVDHQTETDPPGDQVLMGEGDQYDDAYTTTQLIISDHPHPLPPDTEEVTTGDQDLATSSTL